MKLTVRQLMDAGACNEQVEHFRERFGDEIEVTEALAIEHASEFDFGWAAEHLLTAQALAEYERVRAPAWARAYNA